MFQIFVPDNTLVSRIISCDNQVTELFVIDRADKKFVSEYSNVLNKPALYILINRDKRQLYVGETDDSIKRLRNHESKDFWTEAIVFHSTTDTLSTTEVKWLEAKTYEELKRLGYYDLSENKQVPQLPPLKRNQIYTLEPIFEEVKNYICAAGFDIFLKKIDEEETQPQEQYEQGLILCTITRKSEAKGLFNPSTNEIIVLKGGMINPQNLPNLKGSALDKRKEMIKKYAKKDGDKLILKQDITFNSPSAAAKFCIGGAADGWFSWIDEEGRYIDIYRTDNYE